MKTAAKKGMKIKNILISQPEPDSKSSPYYNLADKHKLNLKFKPFIQIEGVTTREFRRQKINMLDFSAVIFTSRSAIDHFFRLCEDLRVNMPQATKYFCMTESIALYLQKYILYRKRKVFHASGTTTSIKELVKKHKEEKFLFPCSDIHKKVIPDYLAELGSEYMEGVIYRTVYSDLSDLQVKDYDMIVFFSPRGIESFQSSFPEFEQGPTKIAAFGPTTTKSVESEGLRLDVKAPEPQSPSMAMAIDNYLKTIK
jgi:uroporphyrinogen-III synthase